MKEASAFFIGLLALILGGAFLVNASAAAPVEQPIDYPHIKHTVFLECKFCHKGVEDYAQATIPNVDTCMTCHQSPVTDNPEADKIKEYAERGEEIPWVRLYGVPDHVYFTHKRHVRADVDCTTCHGNMGETVRAVKAFDLPMQFCVDCHKERKVSTDCLTCHR
jgi:hypothetical protein